MCNYPTDVTSQTLLDSNPNIATFHTPPQRFYKNHHTIGPQPKLAYLHSHNKQPTTSITNHTTTAGIVLQPRCHSNHHLNHLPLIDDSNHHRACSGHHFAPAQSATTNQTRCHLEQVHNGISVVPPISHNCVCVFVCVCRRNHRAAREPSATLQDACTTSGERSTLPPFQIGRSPPWPGSKTNGAISGLTASQSG